MSTVEYTNGQLDERCCERRARRAQVITAEPELRDRARAGYYQFERLLSQQSATISTSPERHSSRGSQHSPLSPASESSTSPMMPTPPNQHRPRLTYSPSSTRSSQSLDARR
jgi:hypothetical protein